MYFVLHYTPRILVKNLQVSLRMDVFCDDKEMESTIVITYDYDVKNCASIDFLNY